MQGKKIVRIIIIILLLLILLLIGWSKLQDYIFFHPWNDLTAYKKLQNIDEFKEIEIKNDKVNLSGWFWNIQNKEDKAPLVIFFTGNAQNSSNTLYNYYLSGTMKNVFENYNLMIIDYPGYGRSKGKPSDDSMFIASDYVFEYATKMDEVDKDNIAIMGYSIGTGVASYAASVNNANALILVAPYDKALSLYNDTIDSFHGSVESLAKYSFDSATYAESVDEPTLIFTSKDDEVINYRHSLDLAGHFAELDDVVILDGVNHNSYFLQSEVLEGIKEFLNKNLKGGL
ncbi:MAG: alpha/beta fold hydrolase [Clostridia bacterium]|nr:alpha/beta fold hydrolase [Clostridia bacterium]